MGGSSKSQPQPKVVPQVDDHYYSVMPVARTIQPLAPGHLDRIAAQMARGFGGMPEDFRKQMTAVYRPVDIADYPAAHNAVVAARTAAAVQTPTPTASAKTPAPTPVGNLFGYNPGNWRGGPY